MRCVPTTGQNLSRSRSWIGARRHGVALYYIQPGKPDQNAYIERFNRSYRTEVLDAYAFESITQVRDLTDAWLESYNGERPHDSLGRVPPLTFCRGRFRRHSLTSTC